MLYLTSDETMKTEVCIMGRLLFIGSVVADVIVRLPELPRTGDDVNIMSQQVSLGGCAFNAYSAARLLGADCALFAPVGGGIWGDWVRRALAERGVSTLIPPQQDANGCCYCLVEPDGERTFLCEHGAEYRFQPEWFDLLDGETYDGAYLCGLEVEEETGGVLIDYLEEHPPRTLYFAPGPRICHIPPSRMARILSLHPVLHLNESEALQFTCADTAEEAAFRIHSITGNAVVITLGGSGAYVYKPGCGSVIPACKATVVDAIGAGDAHIGALMAGLSSGLPLEDAAMQANRMSAAVVSHPGATLTAEAWQAYWNKQEKE